MIKLSFALFTFGNAHGSPQHAVTLTANDKVLMQDTVEFKLPGSFGISEVFGVGIDNGSPVLEGARADTPLNGHISDVTFDFSAAQGAH